MQLVKSRHMEKVIVNSLRECIPSAENRDIVLVSNMAMEEDIFFSHR